MWEPEIEQAIWGEVSWAGRRNMVQLLRSWDGCNSGQNGIPGSLGLPPGITLIWPRGKGMRSSLIVDVTWYAIEMTRLLQTCKLEDLQVKSNQSQKSCYPTMGHLKNPGADSHFRPLRLVAVPNAHRFRDSKTTKQVLAQHCSFVHESIHTFTSARKMTSWAQHRHELFNDGNLYNICRFSLHVALIRLHYSISHQPGTVWCKDFATWLPNGGMPKPSLGVHSGFLTGQMARFG